MTLAKVTIQLKVVTIQGGAFTISTEKTATAANGNYTGFINNLTYTPSTKKYYIRARLYTTGSNGPEEIGFVNWTECGVAKPE
jgi:hypothetical protein